jgi:hypothetical protein
MSIYDVKVRPASLGEFTVNDELAGLVPLALQSEQVALTQDIAANGQKEPIILWKGEVIDGRCRQKALVQLNFPIMYKELDEELTKEEVEVFVMSMNTRRNLTESQKVASAAKDYVKHKTTKTIKKVAKAWGISTGILTNAVWILGKYPKELEVIFNGGTIPIVDSSNRHVDSSKITAIYAYFRRMEQEAITDYDHGWQEHTQIHTQKGKEDFYKILSMFNDLDTFRKNNLKIILIEYVNLKHKLSEET